MKSMVVLFALASVACGSLVPLAQPPHHPAVVLDLKGRPLDTAEVINARALHLQAKALEGHHAPLVHAAPLAHSVVAPAVYAAPAAVSHQSRVDVISSPAVVSHAAPVWGAHAALASPLLAHSGLGVSGLGLSGLGHSGLGLSGHGHYLKKRSLEHLAYNVAPVAHSVYAVAAPSAVSHQSRVDVISSPAVVSHAVAAPVVAHAVAAPLVAHVAPSAVSHQSRVDVRTSPAVVSHSVVAAPVVAAHSAWAAPAYGAHSAWAAPAYGAHGHLLKKRSLALAHAVLPSAVSHQSRVDVISSPAVVSHAAVAYAAPVAVAHAAPIAVAHAVPAAVSHQSRVDVISTSAHLAPVAHSAVWTAPAHLSHSGLLQSSPLVHAAHW